MSTFQQLTINDVGYLQMPVGNNAQRLTGPVSFTTVGTTSWTAPAGVTSVQVLVVGGGGGGGSERGSGGVSGGLGGSGIVIVRYTRSQVGG